jgi:4-hydroxybenzoyl-CoA thioesterase
MFRVEKLIRFHHCDPAGIVFFPQYFVLIHELVEDWFSQGLEIDYAKFVRELGMGLPMVKLESEFLAPVPMGQVLTLELIVQRLGNSSIALAVRGTAEGRECLRATLTVVHTSITPMRPVPIPPALRGAMQRCGVWQGRYSVGDSEYIWRSRTRPDCHSWPRNLKPSSPFPVLVARMSCTGLHESKSGDRGAWGGTVHAFRLMNAERS